MPVPSVLVICTANICRSPMAAALLRHALAAQPEPWRSVEVSSAGIAAHAGEPMTENAVAALKKVGVDPARHVSRPLTREMLGAATVVLCMTEAHRAAVRLMAEKPLPHLHLFREFMPDGAAREIADPYGGRLSTYETSRDEMVEAIPSVVAFLKTRPAG